MKVIAYVDVYPWMKPENVMFINQSNIGNWACPTVGGKRYRLTFEVPDPIEVDGEVQASVEEAGI